MDRLGFGGTAECKIWAVSRRIESAFSLGRFLIEVLAALIISPVEIFLEAVTKLRPFDKSVFSDTEKG